MGWFGAPRHATANPFNFDPFAICDCCGFLYNHSQLRFQAVWQGNQLVNTKLLFCPTCFDLANEQGRTIILPPDPKPVIDPRPPNFDLLMYDYRITDEDDPRVTDGGISRITD